MSNTLLALAVMEAKSAIKEGMTVEEMLRAAMKEARKLWVSTDEDLRLRGAIGAVLSTLGHEHPEYAEVVKSLDALRKASAFIQAAQAGLSVTLDEDDMLEPKYPLMKFWNESAD